MNKIDKRFLIITFLFIAALFLFFVSGEMMNGRMNENGWLGANSWWWFSTLVIIVFSIAFGWLIFRKKNKSNKSSS